MLNWFEFLVKRFKIYNPTLFASSTWIPSISALGIDPFEKMRRELGQLRGGWKVILEKFE